MMRLICFSHADYKTVLVITSNKQANYFGYTLYILNTHYFEIERFGTNKSLPLSLALIYPASGFQN